MNPNTLISFLLIILATALSGCEKKEILKHRTVYGEANINGKTLLQYGTVEEGISNKYWYLPLNIGNPFIVKENVCYFQAMLRDSEENNDENFWLILIGIPAYDTFPIINHEYEISVQDKVDLGDMYNSFYWSGELRNYYYSNPDKRQLGVSGLSVPPTHDGFLPLNGTLSFTKYDVKTGDCSVSYNLEGKELSNGKAYSISGRYNGKLQSTKD